VLEAGGCATATAGSTEALVDAIARERPDLVLLDGKLGGDECRGIELVQKVRGSGSAGASLAVVLFPSTEPPAELERQARALGAQLCWDRKIGGRALRKLVDQALGAAEDRPSEGELLSLCERLRRGNPFAALGLPVTAAPEEIRRRYEQLCGWLQPEALVDPGPELRRLVESAGGDLENAYAKLADPESLEAYRLKPERDRVRDQVQAARHEQAETSLKAQEAYRAGQEQLEHQDWPAALASFRRAVEICPRVGEYRAWVGWATYLVYGAQSAVLEEAIKHAKAGMKLAPNHHHPPLILGRLYQFTNRLDLAIRALKRAVQLNPDSIEAVRELRILKMRDQRKTPQGLLSKLLRR
jgi:tetratricopeptide (TPR) repeat protein